MKNSSAAPIHLTAGKGHDQQHNHMSPHQVIKFIEKHGVVLESAHGLVPNLAEAVAKRRIRGSWWADEKGREIFRLTRVVRNSSDILVCRLINGRITYVHRRLWPALVRLASRFDPKRLAKIQEIHTPRGEHELKITPFPRWVPPGTISLARQMSERMAATKLGNWSDQ